MHHRSESSLARHFRHRSSPTAGGPTLLPVPHQQPALGKFSLLRAHFYYPSFTPLASSLFGSEPAIKPHPATTLATCRLSSGTGVLPYIHLVISYFAKSPTPINSLLLQFYTHTYIIYIYVRLFFFFQLQFTTVILLLTFFKYSSFLLLFLCSPERIR